MYTGRLPDPGPLGTLGVGMLFAIAAKAAMPDTEVIVLFGDGAFGLTGFDYDTLIRFNMPIIGIVANNAAWNQVRYGQMERYGQARGEVANVLSPSSVMTAWSRRRAATVSMSPNQHRSALPLSGPASPENHPS